MAQTPPPNTCPSVGTVLAPPQLVMCAKDLMQRPHIDYGDVVVFPDVTYSVINNYRPIKMTIYMPKANEGPYPIVVFAHGGGWTLDPEGAEGLSGVGTLVQLAAHGYVVASPSYRTTGEARFPAQLIDVKTAIRYIKTYGRTYKGDPARVVMWGTSAGGNLAGLVGTTCHLKQFEQAAPLPGLVGLQTPYINPGVDSCVRTAIDWYGPIDFPKMDEQQELPPPGGAGHSAASSPESAYVGCTVGTCPAVQVQAADPITYISADDPPFLIMHGLADRAVAWRQSQEFYDALRAKGVSAKIVLVEGANHMFDGVPDELKQKQVNTVMQWIDEHTKP